MTEPKASDPTTAMLVDELVIGSADAAFVIDERQRIMGWNERARELTGFATEETVGQPCYQVLGSVIADGRAICTPDCAALSCFHLMRPFAVESAVLMTRSGEQVAVSLSTLALGEHWRQLGVMAVVLIRPKRLIRIEAPEDILRVYTLGAFRVFRGRREVGADAWSRRQALALFRFLVAQRGHPVHRESIIETLWPDADPEDGMRHLKVLIHSVRRTLEPESKSGTDSRFLVRDDESYMVPADSVWVDADRFSHLVRHGAVRASQRDTDGALDAFAEAGKLYGGDYMEGETFAEWCAGERAVLRELFLSAMERTVALSLERGDYGTAIETCRRALVTDPTREALHRALMRSLWGAGRVHESIQQFQEIARVLEHDLGVEPTVETRTLHEELVASVTRHPSSV